jgi:hypothetical protein
MGLLMSYYEPCGIQREHEQDRCSNDTWSVTPLENGPGWVADTIDGFNDNP